MSSDLQLHEALLIDSNGDELMQPLLENRSMAMMPVGGKPLVQFWCEHLNQIGVKKLHLAMRRFPEQIRDFVGKGERWGLDITISSIPEDASEDDSYRLISPYIQANTLVSRLDQIPEEGLQQWLTAVSKTPYAPRAAGDAQAAISKLAVMNADSMSQLLAGNETPIITAEAGVLRKINNPKDLWQANMDLLAGKIADPLPSGYEGEKGLSVEVGVQIKPGFEFQPDCSLGRHTLIETKNKIGPNVIIGSHCIVDKSCRIRESVIFDHTYVGSHSDLNRVIVDGRLVYQVDHDLATWIDDPSIVGSTQLKAGAVSFGSRILAILLLALGLPVIALLAVVRTLSGKAALAKDNLYIPTGRDLMGAVTYRPLQVYSLDVTQPFWQKMPWMLSVIKGDMELVGTTPARDANPEVPDWARELAGIRPGVITLYDLAEEKDAETETKYVTDNYYLVTRSFQSNMILVGRWIGRLLQPSAK
jgi:NDP-sugar pyrophosphorylase family protein